MKETEKCIGSFNEEKTIVFCRYVQVGNCFITFPEKCREIGRGERENIR